MKERIYSILEYVLAIMFIQGGARVFLFSEAQVLPGIFTILVGQYAIYLYGLFFFGLGIALLAAKIFKKTGLHKNSLLLMYLSTVYVLVLAIAINGLGFGLLLTVTVGLVAAFLWLRSKLDTEYVDPQEFAAEELESD